MLVLKTFVEKGMLERCFENTNVSQFCNDSRIVENVYKMFVLKIFVEKECLGRCFENANVRKFCNDSCIVENVYKICFENIC